MNKRKMIKALFSVLLSVTLFANSSMVTISHAATDFGELQYWYSDEPYIGRWNVSSLNVYVKKLNGNSSFDFYAYIGYACAQWDDINNVTGIDLSVGTTYTDSPLKVYGGTMDELNELGIFSVESSNNGITIYQERTYEGYWKYGDEKKYQYLFTKVDVCIVDKDHTTAQYKKTATHEIGHALGWRGHSDNSADIMYSKGSTVTSLTSRDINHLAQVY